MWATPDHPPRDPYGLGLVENSVLNKDHGLERSNQDQKAYTLIKKKVKDSAQPMSVPQKGNTTIIRTDNSINMTIDNIDIIWAKKISIVFSNTSSELTPSMTFDPLSTNLPFSRVVGEVSQVDLSLRHSSSQAWV